MRHFLLCLCLLLGYGVMAQDSDSCPESRLQKNDYGYVNSESPLNIREQPNGARLGQLTQWDSFIVLDGADCVANYRWWYVDTGTISGWVAEGDSDTYWLEPVAISESDVITTKNFNLLRLIKEYEGEGNVSATFAVSDTWYALGTGFPDYRAYVWNQMAENEPLTVKPDYGENGYINTIAIANNLLVTGGSVGESIEYWDLTTGEKLGDIENFAYDLAC